MNLTHGMFGTRTYNSWVSMKRRCNDPKFTAYPAYGGQGISYCRSWERFEPFFADMGERPEGTSLDRIDNAKDYGPDNCRWSNPKQQTLNRRQTVFLTFRGETLCQRDWEVRLGLARGALYHRLTVAKWPLELALTLPADMGRRVCG